MFQLPSGAQAQAWGLLCLLLLWHGAVPADSGSRQNQDMLPLRNNQRQTTLAEVGFDNPAAFNNINSQCELAQANQRFNRET